MRQSIYIFLLAFVLFSCSRKKTENYDGSWQRDNSIHMENPFFPAQLHFKGDSLIMIDDYNFKHQIKYKIEGDSIEMTFTTGKIKKMPIRFDSDSSIFLGPAKFYKIPDDFLTTVKFYNLIDYRTNQQLIVSPSSNTIHLIKNNGQTQAILNDQACDLEKIPEFLGISYGIPPPLSLYVGKDIDFKDLVEAYMYIKITRTQKITLVTGNDAFDKFFIVNDYIHIDDSIMDIFFEKNNIPPYPPVPRDKTNKERIRIEINNQADLIQLLEINDSAKYLLLVDEHLEIFDYFQLCERIKGKKNIKKELTAYNKNSFLTFLPKMP